MSDHQALAPRSLYVMEWGKSGPHLVLLHGFGGLASVWADVAAAVSHNTRIIAYDLPGHGQSLTFPGAGPVKLAVGAVLDDLTARGIAGFHLAGHSMGGAIASLMAIAAPERVRSLALLAPGGMGEEINGPVLHNFAAAVTEAELKMALSAMSAPGAAPPDTTLAALAESRRRAGQSAMLETIAAGITRGGRQGVLSKDQLAALPMPLRVLWGTRDSVLPFAQALQMPGAFELDAVEGGGHMLIEEAPERVTGMLLRAVLADRG